MAVGRWMAECFATTTQSEHSTHSVRQPGKEVTYTNFLSSPSRSEISQHTFLSQLCFTLHSYTHAQAHTHTHMLDKPMNSARGGVLDQSGTCFTSVWDRLTKTTETAKRKGEKRIWGKWEARRDKSWREWRQKRGRAENKRENKTPNFTEEDLEHCLQSQVSYVCNCEGPCTGQRSTIKVVTLTVLVGSLYCQNCVCVCILLSSNVCVSTSLTRQNPKEEPKLYKSRRVCCNNMGTYFYRHTCCIHVWIFHEGTEKEQL